MKKFIYLSMLFTAFALMSVSCTKPTDDTPVVKTSGELYPAYVGKWNNDSTINGDGSALSPGSTVRQYEFEFQDVKAIISAKNYAPDIMHYNSWSISGNTLTFSKGIEIVGDQNFIIVSPPTNNKMILQFTDYLGNTYKYFLNK